jgi:hypothetical protein
LTKSNTKVTTSPENEMQILILKGKLMYPKLFQPDTEYEHRWTVDLLLDAEGIKKANENALRIKKNPKYADQFPGYDGSYLRIDRSVLDKAKGENRDPPTVVDPKTRPVKSTTRVGSGTDARVRFMVKKKDNKGKFLSPSEALSKHGGYGMFLLGVMILNLVEYAGRNSDPDVDFVETNEGSFSVDDAGGFDFDKGDSPFDN